MKREPFISQGLFLCILAVAMAWFQTREYGGNIVPRSTPEALADLICILVMLTGVVLCTIGRALPKKKETVL